MQLIEALGTAPNGTTLKLDFEDVLQYLKRHYIFNDIEKRRRDEHRLRAELYRDGGELALIADIDAFFEDPKVKELRKRFVEVAKYCNVTKRVINELSTVYARPAMRSVSGSANDARYQALLRMTRHDQIMKRTNRLLNLHRQLLLGFRVRSSDRSPASDIVTPDRFWAVRHPLDATKCIAVVIDIAPLLAVSDNGAPAFVVWTDSETFQLTENCTLVANSRREHQLPTMPWLLVSLEPATETLLDHRDGSDLIAGHRSVWFQNVLLLKESKSLNNQVFLSGDLQGTPTGQSSDTETDGILGEDVSVQTVDRGVDLSQFRSNADHILETIAANYGIPPSVLRQDGASSGFEIELRRTGIKERRLEQEPIFRDVERQFAALQSAVLQQDAPDLAFFMTDWQINFGDIATPQDPTQQLSNFKEERQLGVTNTLAFMRARDPDLTPEQALRKLQENIAIETYRVREMQELQAMQSGMGAQIENDPIEPEESGDNSTDEGVVTQ